MIKDIEDSLKHADTDTLNKMYPRVDFIKYLQEYGNDDEVAKILDTDDLALTPEQKSSEALVDDSIPDFKKLSERDKPHFPHSNPTGGSSSVNVGGSAGGTNTAPPVNPDDINSGDDSDDFNIDDLNLDDIDLDDLGLDKLDLDDLGVDDVEAEDFDFSEFDTYASEISDDDLASLNIDDINF